MRESSSEPGEDDAKAMTAMARELQVTEDPEASLTSGIDVDEDELMKEPSVFSLPSKVASAKATDRNFDEPPSAL